MRGNQVQKKGGGFKTVSFNPQKDLFSHMQCSFYANDRLHTYKVGDE